MANPICLCHCSELKEGQSMGFDTQDCGQDTIFLVRFEGQIYGWQNKCPHQPKAPMAWKKNNYMAPSGHYIQCYAHGALFEPQSGVCIQGPCIGKRLKSIGVEIQKDGFLAIKSSLSIIRTEPL